MIKYEEAPDIKRKIGDIISRLDLNHIDPFRVACIRSKGSSSRNIIARCHALPRIMQKAMACEAFYIIELLSENFDKLSEEEQIKTLIHELMHIPKAFGGGFAHHDRVTKRKIEKAYRRLLASRVSQIDQT